ncbi:hypothetical protein DPMN_077637 [Dreissena polymorpha]|uniref:Apple domain-containing protein n=1 Tax=Dreissena polymorpha TaxID=45954 RepID=A0A9D3YR08_DREPO|nr:hypothetical protein DPMN_077637 [Dreissena polymorpha]
MACGRFGVVLIIALFPVVVQGHISDTKRINEMTSSLVKLENENYLISDSLVELDTALKSHAAGVNIPAETDETEAEIDAMIDRLESRVLALQRFFEREKLKDTPVKVMVDAVKTDMDAKVKKNDAVMKDITDHVKDAVNNFQSKLLDVNRTANVEVKIPDSALFQGGIGAPCSDYGGECSARGSECRDGKCQCKTGISFSPRQRACLDRCPEYGVTYQIVPEHIIRGFNRLTLNDTTLTKCMERCSTERSFVCRSFDFFPRWEQCYLSADVMKDVGDDAWENNPEGNHYQRDCK